MREPRVYLQHDLKCEQTLALPMEAVRHIGLVLRMRKGHRVWLFNGLGGSYLAEIISISKRQVEVSILEFSDNDPESRLQITLLQAVSRSQHMDYTLQKAVELGVKRVTPVLSEFVNVQFDQSRIDKKLAHWQKIIVNACEQSGRTILPEVIAPIPFAQAVQGDTDRLKILLHPGAQQRLSSQKPEHVSVSLLSGPEGGFSQSEVDLAVDSGYIPIELGPRVLRTETAAVVAISACQTLWGDMA